jgi:hypothetical protein
MMKQKPGLTRRALAQRLSVSETTIDRLIARGLPVVGQRGPAKLYSLTAARDRLRVRERAASTPELTDALLRRTDVLARRGASRIRRLQETHIRVEDAARGWVEIVDRVSTVVRALPDELAARGLVHGEGEAGMRPLIDEVLARHLPVSEQERQLAAEPPLPPEPEPVVVRSRTLPQARAQLVRLQTQLMELLERIVPYRGPGR